MRDPLHISSDLSADRLAFVGLVYIPFLVSIIYALVVVASHDGTPLWAQAATPARAAWLPPRDRITHAASENTVGANHVFNRGIRLSLVFSGASDMVDTTSAPEETLDTTDVPAADTDNETAIDHAQIPSAEAAPLVVRVAMAPPAEWPAADDQAAFIPPIDEDAAIDDAADDEAANDGPLQAPALPFATPAGFYDEPRPAQDGPIIPAPPAPMVIAQPPAWAPPLLLPPVAQSNPVSSGSAVRSPAVSVAAPPMPDPVAQPAPPPVTLSSSAAASQRTGSGTQSGQAGQGGQPGKEDRGEDHPSREQRDQNASSGQTQHQVGRSSGATRGSSHR